MMVITATPSRPRIRHSSSSRRARLIRQKGKCPNKNEMRISTAACSPCSVHGRIATLRATMGLGDLSIYLDNLAMTPIDPRVVALHAETALALRANPNSGEHASGQQAQTLLLESAASVGSFIGHETDDTMFTPSASSALWIAVQDAINRGGSRRIRVVATAIEHPSLLRHLVEADRQERITLTLLPVSRLGQPDPDALRRLCKERIDLICVMAANNEIGTICPVGDFLDIAQEHGARTLVDASQAAGRIAMRNDLARADYVVINGSKMYGPRGLGVLSGAVSRRTRDGLHYLFGTVDAAAAVAMAAACALRATEMGADEARIAKQRDTLQGLLIERVPGLVVNGDEGSRLAGVLHVSAPAVSGEALVARLWGKVDLSTGAACQSGVDGPSHVLRAMKVADWISDGAVRMCVGKFNDDAEIAEAGALVASTMNTIAASSVRRYA